MIKKPIIIQLASGLEPRPVAVLVQVASQYNSKIYVEDGDRKVNAKSIMGMMTLGPVSYTHLSDGGSGHGAARENEDPAVGSGGQRPEG